MTFTTPAELARLSPRRTSTQLGLGGLLILGAQMTGADWAHDPDAPALVNGILGNLGVLGMSLAALFARN